LLRSAFSHAVESRQLCVEVTGPEISPEPLWSRFA
jgi:hypothetical protein